MFLRAAAETDLETLLRLEETCFASDRISRRSWRRLIRSSAAEIVLATCNDKIAGALVLLFNRATDIARIYSIAVDPGFRQVGLARMLLDTAIAEAAERGAAIVRLETRVDNHAAQLLFAAAGFVVFGRIENYYADGTAALRLEHAIWRGAKPERVPFHARTIERADGPAALMMAMGALRSKLTLDQKLERLLWRECGEKRSADPLSLALAALRRGFYATIFTPDDITAPDEAALTLRHDPVTPELLAAEIAAGATPILRMQLDRLRGPGTPRWVAIAGFDGQLFRVHDPISGTTSVSPREISAPEAGIPSPHSSSHRSRNDGRTAERPDARPGGRSPRYRHHGAGPPVASVASFVAGMPDGAERCRTIVNLCRRHAYLGISYHASLLAEARGLNSLPSAADILEFPRRRTETDRLNGLLDGLDLPGSRLAIRCYFGMTSDPRFARLGRAAFRLFGMPLLLVRAARAPDGSWRIGTIRPFSAAQDPGRRARLLPRRPDRRTGLHAAPPGRVRRPPPSCRAVQGAGRTAAVASHDARPARRDRPRPRHRDDADRRRRISTGSVSSTRCSSARPPRSPTSRSASPARPSGSACRCWTIPRRSFDVPTRSSWPISCRATASTCLRRI